MLRTHKDNYEIMTQTIESLNAVNISAPNPDKKKKKCIQCQGLSSSQLSSFAISISYYIRLKGYPVTTTSIRWPWELFNERLQNFLKAV